MHSSGDNSTSPRSRKSASQMFRATPSTRSSTRTLDSTGNASLPPGEEPSEKQGWPSVTLTLACWYLSPAVPHAETRSDTLKNQSEIDFMVLLTGLWSGGFQRPPDPAGTCGWLFEAAHHKQRRFGTRAG